MAQALILPEEIGSHAATAPALRPAVDADAASHRDVVLKYCAPCHNQKTKTAGLSLDTLDFANIPANADTWEKVIRKLGAGVMPPVGRPRPTHDQSLALQSGLAATIHRAAHDPPNPGRTEAFHRL